MTYICELIGSHFKTVDAAPARAASLNDAISYALGAMLDIYERDTLHSAEAQRAFEFWTPDEIKGDLETAGRCDIVMCGGHYVITLEQTDDAI